MGTDTTLTDGGTIAVVRILLLIQGAIAAVALIEAVVFGVAFGAPLSAVVLLTGAGAILTLWFAAAVVRRSRRARKLTLGLQGLWLGSAAIDLLLAVLLTQRGLELVPLLTRVVLPLTIIALLQQRDTRAWFGVTSRRERRLIAAEVSS